MQEQLTQNIESPQDVNAKVDSSNLAKTLGGILILLCLISYTPLDPTPLNLITQPTGISNWLSYPGALLAGTLMFLFGKMSFVLPIGMIVFNRHEGVHIATKIVVDFLILASLTSSFAILSAFANINSMNNFGIIGFGTAAILHDFPGKLITLLISIGYIVRNIGVYRVNMVIVNIVILTMSVFAAALGSVISLSSRWTRRLKFAFKRLYFKRIRPRIVAVLLKLSDPFVTRLRERSSLKANQIKIDRVNALSAPIITRVKLKKKYEAVSLENFVSSEALRFENRDDLRAAAASFNELVRNGKIDI